MLRIDETSNTLVAPQAGGLVTEVNPDRAELLSLLSASWEAFSSAKAFMSYSSVDRSAWPACARWVAAMRTRRGRLWWIR